MPFTSDLLPEPGLRGRLLARCGPATYPPPVAGRIVIRIAETSALKIFKPSQREMHHVRAAAHPVAVLCKGPNHRPARRSKKYVSAGSQRLTLAGQPALGSGSFVLRFNKLSCLYDFCLLYTSDAADD